MIICPERGSIYQPFSSLGFACFCLLCRLFMSTATALAGHSENNISSSAISNTGAKTGTMLRICCSTKVECVSLNKLQHQFNKSQNHSTFGDQQMLNHVSFALPCYERIVFYREHFNFYRLCGHSNIFLYYHLSYFALLRTYCL